MSTVDHARKLLAAALGTPSTRPGPAELEFAFRARDARRAREAVLAQLVREHEIQGCPPVRAYLTDAGIVVELPQGVTQEQRRALALAAAVAVPMGTLVTHVEPPTRAVDGPVLTPLDLEQIGGLS